MRIHPRIARVICLSASGGCRVADESRWFGGGAGVSGGARGRVAGRARGCGAGPPPQGPAGFTKGAWAPVRRPSGAVPSETIRPTTHGTPHRRHAPSPAILSEVTRTRPQGAAMANVAEVTDNNFQA